MGAGSFLPPNLELGYLYNFGKGIGYGRLTADYLLPISLGADSTIYGEAHAEIKNFWKTFKDLFFTAKSAFLQVPTFSGNSGYLGQEAPAVNGYNRRIDLSFGLGYRRLIRDDTLVGVNAFHDTVWLDRGCYSSGSVGLEMAALLPGTDTVDLNFNWYGRLLDRGVLSGVFSRGPSNFDLQAGYSHELYPGGPDLRLHATGYRFSTAAGVHGGRAGVALTTRNGCLSVRAETGKDRIA